MKRSLIFKNTWCMIFHQDHWKNVSVSIEPNTRLHVCAHCGASHVAKRGFTLTEDLIRLQNKQKQK